MASKTRLDAAETSFFANLFTSIAEEMGVTLARTAYSPNIKERRDFSCAVFDGAGNLVAQAAHIPVHLGAMPMSVAAALEAFETLEEGDTVMLNDPYAGGTHLPDITLVTPVHIPAKGGTASKKAVGKPLAYLATRAHHADVGGMSPGSMPLAREIYQEGLRIPPVMLTERGRLNRAVLDMLKANARTPGERAGDLRAQMAAHRIGEVRLIEAAGKYSPARLSRRMTNLFDYGERLMRGIIARIPNGRYMFADHLDDDGISGKPIKIHVAVTINGREAKVDFEGTDPACAGSLNAVEAVTRSAVYYCFLCLLVTPWPATGSSVSLPGALVPRDPPLNEGCFRPIRISVPQGTVLNPYPPHAVAGGNVETSQRIVDVVFGALAQALPDLIPAASQGTMNNLTIGGYDRGRKKRFAYYETIGGGMGARPGLNGLDAVHVHMTNTLNTPVEALEFAYPLRIERYAIARGTGGSGQWRGGNGIERDMRLLSSARGTVLSERRAIAPFGLQGGAPGRMGKNQLSRGKKRIGLPGKAHVELERDDVIRIRTPGGGGFGKPLKRRKKES
ncbi:hydantoinase B/oxoprolinase family protein [Acidobacteriota bacterium]